MNIDSALVYALWDGVKEHYPDQHFKRLGEALRNIPWISWRVSMDMSDAALTGERGTIIHEQDVKLIIFTKRADHE